MVPLLDFVFTIYKYIKQYKHRWDNRNVILIGLIKLIFFKL